MAPGAATCSVCGYAPCASHSGGLSEELHTLLATVTSERDALRERAEDAEWERDVLLEMGAGALSEMTSKRDAFRAENEKLRGRIEAVEKVLSDYHNGRFYEELCGLIGGPSGYVSSFCFEKVRKALRGGADRGDLVSATGPGKEG